MYRPPRRGQSPAGTWSSYHQSTVTPYCHPTGWSRYRLDRRPKKGYPSCTVPSVSDSQRKCVAQAEPNVFPTQGSKPKSRDPPPVLDKIVIAKPQVLTASKQSQKCNRKELAGVAAAVRVARSGLSKTQSLAAKIKSSLPKDLVNKIIDSFTKPQERGLRPWYDEDKEESSTDSEEEEEVYHDSLTWKELSLMMQQTSGGVLDRDLLIRFAQMCLDPVGEVVSPYVGSGECYKVAIEGIEHREISLDLTCKRKRVHFALDVPQKHRRMESSAMVDVTEEVSEGKAADGLTDVEMGRGRRRVWRRNHGSSAKQTTTRRPCIKRLPVADL